LIIKYSKIDFPYFFNICTSVEFLERYANLNFAAFCYFAKEKVKVKESDNWNLNDERVKEIIFNSTKRMVLPKYLKI